MFILHFISDNFSDIYSSSFLQDSPTILFAKANPLIYVVSSIQKILYFMYFCSIKSKYTFFSWHKSNPFSKTKQYRTTFNHMKIRQKLNNNENKKSTWSNSIWCIFSFYKIIYIIRIIMTVTVDIILNIYT